MTADSPGLIRWMDLTVPDAAKLCQFYQAVVGWVPEAVSMGDYNDWCLIPEGSIEPVAGICHARGPNAGLPPVWLVYITVTDLNESMQACRELGGEVLLGPKPFGGQGTWCIIRDPAGAVAALFEPKSAA